jgi:HSP20 family molecular chaperone IbpA
MSVDPRSWMWSEACALMAQAEQLRRQFSQPSLSGPEAGAWEPPIDVVETPKEVRLVAALPGVDPSNIEVRIEQDTIVIRGARKLPPMGAGAVIHRLEIPHGRFERRVKLAGSRLKVARSEVRDGCLLLGLDKLA